MRGPLIITFLLTATWHGTNKQMWGVHNGEDGQVTTALYNCSSEQYSFNEIHPTCEQIQVCNINCYAHCIM